MQVQEPDVQTTDKLILQLKQNLNRNDMKASFIKYYVAIKSRKQIVGDIKQPKVQNQLLLEYLMEIKAEIQGYDAVKRLVLGPELKMRYLSFLARRNMPDEVKSIICFLDYQIDSPVAAPVVIQVSELSAEINSAAFLRTPQELQISRDSQEKLINFESKLNDFNDNAPQNKSDEHKSKSEDFKKNNANHYENPTNAIPETNKDINNQLQNLSTEKPEDNYKTSWKTFTKEQNNQNSYENPVLYDDQQYASRKSLEQAGLDEVERRLSALEQKSVKTHTSDLQRQLRAFQSDEDIESHITEIMRPGQPQVGDPAPAVTGIIDDLNDMLNRISTPGAIQTNIFRSRVITDAISDTLNAVHRLSVPAVQHNAHATISPQRSTTQHVMPFPNYSYDNLGAVNQDASLPSQKQKNNNNDNTQDHYGPGESLDGHKRIIVENLSINKANNHPQPTNREESSKNEAQQMPQEKKDEMDELKRSLAVLDASLNASLSEVSNFRQNALHKETIIKEMERTESPIIKQNAIVEALDQKEAKKSPQSAIINITSSSKTATRSRQFLKMLENVSDQTRKPGCQEFKTEESENKNVGCLSLHNSVNDMREEVNCILSSSKESLHGSHKGSNMISTQQILRTDVTTKLITLKMKQDQLKNIKAELEQRLAMQKLQAAMIAKQQKPLLEKKLLYCKTLANKCKHVSMLGQRLYLKSKIMVSKISISFQNILNKYPQINQYYLSGKSVYQGIYNKISEICIYTFKKLKLLQKLKTKEVEDLKHIQIECLSEEKANISSKMEAAIHQRSMLESRSTTTATTNILTSKTDLLLNNYGNVMNVEPMTSKLLTNIPSTASPSHDNMLLDQEIQKPKDFYQKIVYKSPQVKFVANNTVQNYATLQLQMKKNDLDQRLQKLQVNKLKIDKLQELNNKLVALQNIKQRLENIDTQYSQLISNLQGNVKLLHKLDKTKLAQPLLYLSYFKQHHNLTIRCLLMNCKKQHMIDSELKFSKLKRLANERKAILQIRYAKRILQMFKQVSLDKHRMIDIVK